MKAVNKKLGLLAICAGALTLVACGGDSSTVPLTLRGVSATGFAIDGGTVNVQCVTGTGTATTLANGSYSVTVENGQGPCLITVTKGTGPTAIVLRSIAPKTTSGTAVANVTPFSNAIVEALVIAKGAGTVQGLITGTTSVPTNSELTAAVTAVVTQINKALSDKSLPTIDANTDLLGKVDFVAATPDNLNGGDALDKALDALVTGTTLPDALNEAIKTATDTVVDPTPTGATGGN